MKPASNRAHRLLFWGILAALAWGLVELCSFAAYFALYKEPFSFRRISLEQEGIPTHSGGAKPEVLKYVPHPYLGYVMNPALTAARYNWFIDSDRDPFDAASDAIHVVIIGGSVAFNFRNSWNVFAEGLSALPAFRDRGILRISLAGLGYKQPQQLLAVAYFLALGGRIDLLVNLDGFNEIGSEIQRNIDRSVYPAYPAFWPDVARDWTTDTELQRLGEVAALRKLRARIAEAADAVGFSVTVGLGWKLLDGALDRAIYRRAVADQRSLPIATHARGPAFEGDDTAARRQAVALWARSSELLADLAERERFAYFHFLQPNQYVTGAKRNLTTSERNLRVTREEYKRTIPRWYPELQKAGAQLRERGVRFFDLTLVHQDVEETVYYDDCCHFTALGRDVMARNMADVIARELGDSHHPSLEAPPLAPGVDAATR